MPCATADDDVLLDDRVAILARGPDRVAPKEADTLSDRAVASEHRPYGVNEVDPRAELDVVPDVDAIEGHLRETQEAVRHRNVQSARHHAQACHGENGKAVEQDGLRDVPERRIRLSVRARKLHNVPCKPRLMVNPLAACESMAVLRARRA